MIHSLFFYLFSSAEREAAQLMPIIRSWAGENLISLNLSGSFAKNTEILSSTDIDLFVSLRASTLESLREIYESLYAELQKHWPNILVERQNVSIGVKLNSAKIDVVPAIKQSMYGEDHYLYSNRNDTWIRTNIAKHISFIKNSGRAKEICILKLWRFKRNINISSFLLELAVIEALRGRPMSDSYNNLSSNVFCALEFLESEIKTCRLVDPANNSNIVSDSLSVAEKQSVSFAAKKSNHYWR